MPDSSLEFPSAFGAIPWPSSGSRGGSSIRVQANWKVMLENYNECYHCGPVHPELCRLVPAFKQRGGADLDWERGIPHRDGAWTFTDSGTTTRAPFDGLSEDERVRHKGELIYPNFLLSLSADHVAAFTSAPTPPAAPPWSASSCSIPPRWRRPTSTPPTRWTSGTW